MTRPPVTFDRVFKKFRRGERHDSLRDLIPSFARRAMRRQPPVDLGEQEFWAVRDVSFTVGVGEALGIIGPNGAGKSTVLKLLTRILKPTRGHCEVRGRAGALIEVAAGFHPDLTGRENVFLQGAIMGMKQAEIARTFDEIVEFAGVADFIDTPVKRYSSGMNARLGFAIAAHLDPDVLIIDEVLSVGDARFQERCLERMRELRARGIPLVFVSHNLLAVLELCTRAILIDRGSVRFDGSPNATIQEYRRARPVGQADPARADRDVHIASVQFLDDRGRSADVIETGACLKIRIHYAATRPVERPHFGVDIIGGDGVHCYGINTRMDRLEFGTLRGAGHVDLVIPRLALLPGCYTLSVAIQDTPGITPHDYHYQAYPFSVTSDRRDLGLVYLEHRWESAALTRAHEPQAMKEVASR
jgi:homopolymeric O-antigen transport system ATP-binding protein